MSLHDDLAAAMPATRADLERLVRIPSIAFDGFPDAPVREAAEATAAILVDASVRDLEELVELGLPIWARYVRIRGAVKETLGELDVPVEVGGTTIRPGDIVVLDADGAAVVEQDRVAEVLEGALKREAYEADKRAKLQGGALSYDLDGLREIVEAE